MVETANNLVLDDLRRLDKKVDALADDLHEARGILSGVAQDPRQPGRPDASGRGAAGRDREAVPG